MNDEEPPPISAPTDEPAVKAPQGPFCQFCGKPVLPRAVICVSCGQQIKPLEPPEPSGFSCVVMIVLGTLSLFIPCIGLVVGISAMLMEGKKTDGAILIVISIASALLMAAMGGAFGGAQSPYMH